jgi:LPS-assembly lipoprotein
MHGEYYGASMRKNRDTFIKWLFLLSAVVALSACGFHLRGKPDLPFKTIYLSVAPTSQVGIQLKRYLRAAGVTVIDDKKDAEATFQMLAESREQKILTLNTLGQVSEYMLYQRSTFTVTDSKGAALVRPTEIVLKRDMTYNPSQELASQAQMEILYKDMQSDLVQQILRRMSSITKTPAVPVKSAE